MPKYAKGVRSNYKSAIAVSPGALAIIHHDQTHKKSNYLLLVNQTRNSQIHDCWLFFFYHRLRTIFYLLQIRRPLVPVLYSHLSSRCYCVQFHTQQKLVIQKQRTQEKTVCKIHDLTSVELSVRNDCAMVFRQPIRHRPTHSKSHGYWYCRFLEFYPLQIRYIQKRTHRPLTCQIKQSVLYSNQSTRNRVFLIDRKRL